MWIYSVWDQNGFCLITNYLLPSSSPNSLFYRVLWITLTRLSMHQILYQFFQWNLFSMRDRNWHLSLLFLFSASFFLSLSLSFDFMSFSLLIFATFSIIIVRIRGRKRDEKSAQSPPNLLPIMTKARPSPARNRELCRTSEISGVRAPGCYGNFGCREGCRALEHFGSVGLGIYEKCDEFLQISQQLTWKF